MNLPVNESNPNPVCTLTPNSQTQDCPVWCSWCMPEMEKLTMVWRPWNSQTSQRSVVSDLLPGSGQQIQLHRLNSDSMSAFEGLEDTPATFKINTQYSERIVWTEIVRNSEATLMTWQNGTPELKLDVVPWSKAFDTVLQRNVDEPNRQLAELRFLRDAFDRSILQQTSNVGFRHYARRSWLADRPDQTYDSAAFVCDTGTDVEVHWASVECVWDRTFNDTISKEDLDHYYDWTTAPPALSDLVYNGTTGSRQPTLI